MLANFCIINGRNHIPMYFVQTAASGEVENEQAVKSLQTIRGKLQGVMQTGLPVSIEGRTQELIKQATNPSNLFQMYIGGFVCGRTWFF